jgi:hypothetical protein
MFIAQMAFFNRVSDARIGGTYLTMLNTLANLGGQWPLWHHCAGAKGRHQRHARLCQGLLYGRRRFDDPRHCVDPGRLGGRGLCS